MATEWNDKDDERLPWPISEAEEDVESGGRWSGVVLIVLAVAAAVAIIWGTIDYFAG